MLESFHRGAVAQLGERRVRNAKVVSSILIRSTNSFCQNPRGTRLRGFFIWATWLLLPPLSSLKFQTQCPKCVPQAEHMGRRGLRKVFAYGKKGLMLRYLMVADPGGMAD